MVSNSKLEECTKRRVYVTMYVLSVEVYIIIHICLHKSQILISMQVNFVTCTVTNTASN